MTELISKGNLKFMNIITIFGSTLKFAQGWKNCKLKQLTSIKTYKTNSKNSVKIFKL